MQDIHNPEKDRARPVEERNMELVNETYRLCVDGLKRRTRRYL